MKLSTLVLTVLALVAAALFIAPAAALGADVPPPQPTQALASVQFWTAVIGFLVPLLTYVINHYAPWVDEKAKGLVLLGAAAAAGALYPLVQSGDWAFDTRHMELVGSAVFFAFVGHHAVWKPTTIAQSLGAGSNVIRGH